MSAPLFSHLFTFRSRRRNRRSFVLLLLVCLAVELAVAAWILIPAYLGQQHMMQLVASGQPLPRPEPASALRLAMGLSSGVALLALFAAAVVALWSAAAQRFHDLGYSGWALLWMLVPFINVYFVYLVFFRLGTAGPNRFGPDPLAQPAGAAAPPG